MQPWGAVRERRMDAGADEGEAWRTICYSVLCSVSARTRSLPFQHRFRIYESRYYALYNESKNIVATRPTIAGPTALEFPSPAQTIHLPSAHHDNAIEDPKPVALVSERPSTFQRDNASQCNLSSTPDTSQNRTRVHRRNRSARRLLRHRLAAFWHAAEDGLEQRDRH